MLDKVRQIDHNDIQQGDSIDRHEQMKSLLLQIFTWWRGQTIGTRFYTWRRGERVGLDDFGNTYYRNSDDSRRWVIYADAVEASMIPPGWHGWMHHKTKISPSDENYKKHAWELPHSANKTGSRGAYRPASSLLNVKPKDMTQGDYESWSP